MAPVIPSTPPAPRPTALVVDDEVNIVELLGITLETLGIDMIAAHSLADAYLALDRQVPTFCLTDLRLPDGSGMDLVQRIQQRFGPLPVAVITAFSSTDGAVEAMRAGAFDYLTKPVELQRLRELIRQALAAAAPHPAGAAPAQRLIGDSPAMRQIREQIGLLGRSNAPVLITGETGTGKELVARSIHETGSRATGPFMAVNCGAIPEGLMESEFFGAEKGAFSGATQRRRGLLVSANGGTLFLDEIGELPLSMQVKLLRALQERKVRPLGSLHEEDLDIRLICATHRDLPAMVAEGRFRQDLFYRIHVVPLQLPPLRQRPEDIPDLARALLARVAQRQDRGGVRLSDGALAVLQHWPFPGNVRELENLLERLLALHPGPLIDASALQTLAPPSSSPVSPAASGQTTSRQGVPVLSLRARLAQAEAQVRQRVLAEQGGDLERSAQVLCISPLSLTLRQTLARQP